MLALSGYERYSRFRVASGKAEVLSACAMVALMCWALVSLAACGSESSASSSSLDTDENRALLAQSGLIRDFASSDTEQIITAPWVAVEHVQDEDAGDVWRIVGSSEQELSMPVPSNSMPKRPGRICLIVFMMFIVYAFYIICNCCSRRC